MPTITKADLLSAIADLEDELLRLKRAKAGMKGAYEGHRKRDAATIAGLQMDARAIERRLNEVNQRRLAMVKHRDELQEEVLEHLSSGRELASQAIRYRRVAFALGGALIVHVLAAGVLWLGGGF